MTSDSAPTGKPLTPERLAEIRACVEQTGWRDRLHSELAAEDLLAELDRRVSPALSAETVQEAYNGVLERNLFADWQSIADALTTHLRTQAE